MCPSVACVKVSGTEELPFVASTRSEEDLADAKAFELELLDNESKSLRFGMSLMDKDSLEPFCLEEIVSKRSTSFSSCKENGSRLI